MRSLVKMKGLLRMMLRQTVYGRTLGHDHRQEDTESLILLSEDYEKMMIPSGEQAAAGLVQQVVDNILLAAVHKLKCLTEPRW